MTEYTRPAIGDEVKAVARYFAEAGVEYALVDAYAIAAHGFSRMLVEQTSVAIRFFTRCA